MKDRTTEALADAADELLRAADAVRKRVHFHTCDYDHKTYQTARRTYKAARAHFDKAAK